jgi:hypothetical protein
MAPLRAVDFVFDATATECSFRNALLDRLKAITNIRFGKCDFTGAKMRSSRLEQTVFENCVFDDAILDHSTIIGCTFIRCSMNRTSTRDLLTGDNRFIDSEAEALRSLAVLPTREARRRPRPHAPASGAASRFHPTVISPMSISANVHQFYGTDGNNT